VRRITDHLLSKDYAASLNTLRGGEAKKANVKKHAGVTKEKEKK